MKRQPGPKGATAELQGEIERLAQQQDHVGAVGDIGVGAQAGVVEAARTLAEACGIPKVASIRRNRSRPCGSPAPGRQSPMAVLLSPATQ